MAALTDDQAAVYDRQLRVWGVDVQKRLIAARVLIAGSGSGLAAEVAKNIVLAGVGLVTIVDDTPSSSSTSSLGNFLVQSETKDGSVAEATASTLQAMNPLIVVKSGSGNPATISVELLMGHDIVVAADLTLGQAQQLDVLCTQHNKQLFIASASGPNSYVFSNMQLYSYSKKESPDVTVRVQFESLAAALATPLSKLNKRTHPLFAVLRVVASFEASHQRAPGASDLPALIKLAHSMASSEGAPPSIIKEDLLASLVTDTYEMAPVSAVTGGVLANYIVRAISQAHAPLQNFFFYCLFDGSGTVERMP